MLCTSYEEIRVIVEQVTLTQGDFPKINASHTTNEFIIFSKLPGWAGVTVGFELKAGHGEEERSKGHQQR